MARRPRLSIVLSCYTKSPWFVETLESILTGYHMRNTEIILCDDASPLDGGEGVTAREYAKKYPDFIRTFRNGERSGIAKSYSRLLEETKGEFFMPFDSDDIFVPFDVDGSMDFLDANRDYAGTYGKKRLFSAEQGDKHTSHGGDMSLFAMHIDPRITHNAMVIRTSDLREAGGYQETTLGINTAMADVYMWTRLCSKKKVIFFDQNRAFYRVHDGQYSQSRFETYKSEYAYVSGRLREMYKDIYEALRDRRPVGINDENRAVVQMLLGGMFNEDLGANEKLAIVDTAARIMPEDYGVFEHRAHLFLKHKQPQDALRDAAQVLLCMPDSLYVRSVGSKLGMQATEMIWNDKGIFESANQKALGGFFSMTPEQKTLMEKVVAHAKANS